VDEQEVGRWPCPRCSKAIVAVGPRDKKFKGTGAFIGTCPWECGAWITRAFRQVKPGRVRACRADDWDGRTATA
jgi:hypothetical protein